MALTPDHDNILFAISLDSGNPLGAQLNANKLSDNAKIININNYIVNNADRWNAKLAAVQADISKFTDLANSYQSIIKSINNVMAKKVLSVDANSDMTQPGVLNAKG